MYGYHTDLLAVGYEVIDGLTRGFRHRTHGDDDAVCIFGAVVIEEAVFATGELVDLFHIFLHDGGHFVVEAIASLAVLEEVVGVLSHTARHGVHRVQGAGAELGQGLLIDERSEILVVELLDLLDLVRGAEAIEEAHEGDARLEGGQVGHTGQVHHLLHGAFGQHGEARLAYGHHVLVVAEDGEGVRGQGTCGNVEDAGQELTRDLVHVRDHEQQSL